ncbi:DUF3306 domain-containing protein [Variovorax dokdonensis]|uniref:DUF3306 domain-containing protein n=1 Tax=Variovorax dokdonensis TaxID=344883 RepID=A0ABT7NA61_9BURK|nr:DUF3306 domain-containing protein [Variovorax dokdonensis]MDM0044835.1 DUF3306 domain-containing protein [Variovorax dokdonensis]
MSSEEDKGFLSRWSQRKVRARRGEELPIKPAPADVPVPATGGVAGQGEQALPAVSEKARDAAGHDAAQGQPDAPPLTLDDVATLDHQSDFSRFVAPEVSGEVRNAALKKLFSDPHFNVMDGLDVYIDDYGKPDPLPASMLRQMAQAAYLGLVEPEKPGQPENGTVDETVATKPHDENPDLRLQSLHDPGPSGPEPGTGEGTGRQG